MQPLLTFVAEHLDGFHRSAWHSAAGRRLLCGLGSGKSAGAHRYHLGINYPIIPAKTPLHSFAKTERNNSTRRCQQPALGRNALSPNATADEKIGVTTPEIPDSLILLPSYQELELESSLGCGSSMRKSREAFDQNESPNIKTAAGSKAPSVRSAKTEHSSTTTSCALTTNKKRSAADDDDDDEDFPDENSDGSKRPTKRIKSESETPLRLACPFWKKDPRKYNIHEHRVCASRAWDSVSRVKEHLYRRHLAPPYCKRCKKAFDDEETLQVHLFARIPCSFEEGEPPDGISGAMKKALKNRKNTNPKQSQSERWKEIYRMLFPGSQVPEPWFGPVRDWIELGDFEAYCQQELPKVIRSHFETEIGKDKTTLDDSALSQTVKIVQFYHSMVLSNYRSQLPSLSTNNDPNKAPSASDICNNAASSRSTELTSFSTLTECNAISMIPQNLVYEPQVEELNLWESSLTVELNNLLDPFHQFDLPDPFHLSDLSQSWIEPDNSCDFAEI